MKHDAKVACVIALVAPCLVDLGDIAIRIGEAHLTHRHGNIALDEDRCVLRFELAPVVQREAFVSREVGIVTNEVRERALTGCAKRLRRGRQGRFEKDRTEIVAVS